MSTVICNFLTKLFWEKIISCTLNHFKHITNRYDEKVRIAGMIIIILCCSTYYKIYVIAIFLYLIYNTK